MQRRDILIVLAVAAVLAVVVLVFSPFFRQPQEQRQSTLPSSEEVNEKKQLLQALRGDATAATEQSRQKMRLIRALKSQ